MLVRLEVSGFKNLLDLSVEFGPFTCLAGPNAVGKSNVFDAIRFLSLLSDHTLLEAALGIRGSDPETTSLESLFWTDGTDIETKMRLVAEMIVDEEVIDDFGRPARASSTFLRYEIELGYVRPGPDETLGRIELLSERLNQITEGDASKHLRFEHSATRFRKAAVANRRSTSSGFISTRPAADGQTEILVHGDGGSRGSPRRSPASKAPRTIVGTTNTSDDPTILAARREMQAWRILALEPSAMRGPDKFHADPHITVSGDHLPATLYRLSTSGGDPERICARVANSLSAVVPVQGVRVVRDDVRQLLTVEVQERSGTTLPARSLSDGTLRFMTLCVLALDAEARGVVCMEEPENGIHPARMGAMVELLHDLAVDTSREPSRENPMRQVIIATHSPVMVQLMNPDDLLCAVSARVRGPSGRPATTLRCRPLQGTWRTDDTDAGVGRGSILAYLTKPVGAQLSLEDAIA